MRLEIALDADVALAIAQARSQAEAAGFDEPTCFKIATATSELARNILKYAGRGHVLVRVLNGGDRRGIEIVAKDDGPGIADVERALEDHFSSGGSLGLGLPGVRRMMDEFEVVSAPGKGTRVRARKWV